MMEYTSSVKIEVAQKDGKTIYSDFNVEVDGIQYQKKEKKNEMDYLAEKLYTDMKRLCKKWKKKRIR